MTTEEKAKAYDEAIVIAKSCLEKGVNPANNPLDYFIGCVCKMFPNSFPELRESEDERIRNFLINKFEEVGEIWGEYSTKDVIAYLEKQKERGPLTKEEEYTLQRIIEHLEDEGCLQSWIDLLYDIYNLPYGKQKPAECIEDSVKFEEGFKAGRESGLRDGQKYVLNNLDSYGLCKSAKWSEEDETRLTNILIMLKEYVIHHYSKDDVNKSVGWLENRAKFLRPVKQEWSEEDEKRIQSILFSIGYCKEEYPDKKNYSKDINWLKSLRPQPHWKPSEQEKGALRTAIYILTEERNFPKAAAQLQNILDIFDGEEPRKEWKPSEEQMVALKEACDKHWEPDGIEPLYTLYQDLKKL